jgi:hypothetical protein
MVLQHSAWPQFFCDFCRLQVNIFLAILILFGQIKDFEQWQTFAFNARCSNGNEIMDL